MADGASKGRLPRFPGAKLIVWKAGDWNKVADMLESWRPLPGRNVQGQVTTTGTLLHAEPGGATTTSEALAFHTLSKVGSDWILQGGQVSGGSGNEVVADITLAAVGSEPADGTKHWIEITGDGVTDSGVLLPGYDVTAATTGSGATLPANTLPTASAATGKKVYVLLGSWSDSVFTPSQGGNVTVSFCPGGYTITRGS